MRYGGVINELASETLGIRNPPTTSLVIQGMPTYAFVIMSKIIGCFRQVIIHNIMPQSRRQQQLALSHARLIVVMPL